jgi:formylglycine-generating enzyme required for sulfatase activity
MDCKSMDYKMYKLFFLIIITFMGTVLSAQSKCYDILYQKGKSAFAAGKYEDALKKFNGAKDCSDKPAVNDLNAQIQLVQSKLPSPPSPPKPPKPVNKPIKSIPKTQPEKPSQTRDKAQQEKIDWEIATGIGQESAFWNYLEKYPTGWHSKEARQRMDILQQNQKNTPIAVVPAPVTPPVVVQKTIFKPEMVEMEGGIFSIGDAKSIYPDEKPVKKIRISRFKMGKYEITQGQWFAVMQGYPKGLPEPYCENCPIRMVSWDDAQGFIRKANELTGQNYRLPTEAEWEFAAKGGAQSSNVPYAGSDNLSSVGWYAQNAVHTVHPVGSKSSSNNGLFDMNGNIAEWCADFYGENYTHLTPSDPKGATTGDYRVFRGGSWDDALDYCRNAMRSRETPNYRDERIGFRLAQDE